MDRQRQEALFATAERQHGVVTSRQADAILGPSRKAYWVRTGRLLAAQPGTLRLAGAPATWHADLMAAQLSSGGLVSHRSSGELWGLVRPEQAVEVTPAPGRHPRLLPPAVSHRVKDLHREHGVRRAGLLITDPRRTLVDLGLVLPVSHVAEALSTALSSKLVRWEDVMWLREALGRRGRNGTGIIGELLERRRPTAGREESVLEARFVDLLSRRSVRVPSLQHEIWDAGRFVARVDGAYPEVRLAIELDGYAKRASPERFEHDIRRQTDLVALGWTVLRFTWGDVVRHASVTVERLLATYARLARSLDLCASLIT